MHIPMLDLKAQYSSYRDQALAALTRVADSQYFIMGPEVVAFEQSLADYTRVHHVRGMSSGTDALLAALMALEVGPGDEVVTTAFSFFATAGVIARLGAKPVFVDIDPHTFNATQTQLEQAGSANTKAMIPVHLYGQMSDLEELNAKSSRPAIIEDAAQSLGARFNGRMTGHFGDCACVSFFPSKNLGGFGDGGAVLTHDEAFAERLHIMRVHGAKPKYFHHVVGGNFRLDAIQAAVLAVKLPHLDTWADGRRANAERYNGLFAQSGLVDRGLITLPVESPGAHHVYNQYVLRTQRRDSLKAHLAERGVSSMIYYPTPLHLQPCFAQLGYAPGDFPHAERAANEVLAIPVYPELTLHQQRYIVEQVSDFFGL